MKSRIFQFVLVLLTCTTISNAAIVSGNCGGQGDGSNMTWTINTKDSTFTISGTGRMAEDPYYLWDEYAHYIIHINWNVITTNYFRGGNNHPFVDFIHQVKSITFGTEVEYVPGNLCDGANNLRSITCIGNTPPSVGTDAFNNTHFLYTTLYVPEESVIAYSNSLWWEEFNIRPIGYYIVKFVDWDGTILSSNYVKEGQNATAPTTPQSVGYTFTGWNKPYNSVSEDIIITALYKLNSRSLNSPYFHNLEHRLLQVVYYCHPKIGTK